MLGAVRTVSRGKLLVVGGALAVLVVAVAIGFGPLGAPLERLVGAWQNTLAAALRPTSLRGPQLYLTAFAGGLLASLSPCILGMLPVNLSYIGASRVETRAGAMRVATLFVLGVIVVTVILGLAASLFFAVFVVYRAFIAIGVGALTIAMGLWMAGLLKLPVRAIAVIPAAAGPFVVGLVFALVASPCASPVLVAVLGAAGASGNLLDSVVAMTAYAIGYTIVLWLASVFAGVAVASRRLLQYGELITRVGAGALLLFGAVLVLGGIRGL